MDELVVWLRAQLDEDERIARSASDGPWKPGVRSGLDVVEGDGWTVCDASDVDVVHIAAHDPARVLREIDAKRQLLALHQEKQEQGYGTDLCAECGFGEVSQSYYPCATLRLLTLPYADRPGYREEWRP
ncbi:DUF6221 family protein [Streptomyces longwoodensis]|uniref:DUF6221 family protein n=1 Tax=Streptomyces longwoodensis TaxID=68231 RepID=UPI0036E51909